MRLVLPSTLGRQRALNNYEYYFIEFFTESDYAFYNRKRYSQGPDTLLRIMYLYYYFLTLIHYKGTSSPTPVIKAVILQ